MDSKFENLAGPGGPGGPGPGGPGPGQGQGSYAPAQGGPGPGGQSTAGAGPGPGPGGQSTGGATGRGQDVNVVYNVGGMSQPTNVTCWATSFAVVINFRDNSNITPLDVCRRVGQDPNQAELWETVTQAAQAYNLQQSASACMNVQGWVSLLEQYGPLWISINEGSHAVVLNGAQGDGTAENTTFYVTDPYDGPETQTLQGLNAMFEALGTEQPGDGLIIWHR